MRPLCTSRKVRRAAGDPRPARYSFAAVIETIGARPCSIAPFPRSTVATSAFVSSATNDDLESVPSRGTSARSSIVSPRKASSTAEVTSNSATSRCSVRFIQDPERAPRDATPTGGPAIDPGSSWLAVVAIVPRSRAVPSAATYELAATAAPASPAPITYPIGSASVRAPSARVSSIVVPAPSWPLRSETGPAPPSPTLSAGNDPVTSLVAAAAACLRAASSACSRSTAASCCTYCSARYRWYSCSASCWWAATVAAWSSTESVPLGSLYTMGEPRV